MLSRIERLKICDPFSVAFWVIKCSYKVCNLSKANHKSKLLQSKLQITVILLRKKGTAIKTEKSNPV